MKKTLFYLIPIVLASSCAPKGLYSWGKYDSASYSYLKKNDEKATQELIKTYQAIIAKQKGTRKVVPPGIYADYGFILIQTGKLAEGSALLEKEMALYPESAIFIKRILNTSKK
jgi:hypothetical protein